MEETTPHQRRMNDSPALQTGTSSSSTQFSRTSTILTVPDSPFNLSTSLQEKLETLANQERERESTESNDSNEVPAWDRSGPILTPPEDDPFEDPPALEWQEWQEGFWERSGVALPKFIDNNGRIFAHQPTEWGNYFNDETSWGDHDDIEWETDFYEVTTGNEAWDPSGVTDPRYSSAAFEISAEDDSRITDLRYTLAEEIVDLSAWDVSGVTDRRYLVAAFWDKSGVYLPSAAELEEEESRRVNDSAILCQHYFDFYLNPPNIHKLTYYLENFPNELEFFWQEYLQQTIEGEEEMIISESAYLETFKQFAQQLELARRDFGQTSFSFAPSPVETEEVDSFYSADEEHTTYTELFKPRLLSELVESGRRSTDDLPRGRTSDREFVFLEEVKRPHSLDDIIALCTSVRNGKRAQMEEDLPSLGRVVTRRPSIVEGGFHLSIEPCMSGGRSPGNSRRSSRSPGILPAVADTPVLQQMNTGAEQDMNRMASKGSRIGERNSGESKEYTLSMDCLIQPSINYIPSLGELKERPARRKRFDKFRNKMKFWRSKEKVDIKSRG